MGTIINMGKMVYVSGADHRATAERHFREAEQKMLAHFEGLKKGYSAEVKGWKLTLECDGDKDEIDLSCTCLWKVESYDDIKMTVVRCELDGKPCELIFSPGIIVDTDTVKYMGMRRP